MARSASAQPTSPRRSRTPGKTAGMAVDLRQRRCAPRRRAQELPRWADWLVPGAVSGLMLLIGAYHAAAVMRFVQSF